MPSWILYWLLVMQCSAGSNRFRNKPCNTDRTLGRCTNCKTNKCDWKKEKSRAISDIWFFKGSQKWHAVNTKICYRNVKNFWMLTQQQAVTVICIVFRPGWHTFFRYKGLCDDLFSPRSMPSGFALTETVTDAGQFVLICRSSWWKHFNCSSKSDLKFKTRLLPFLSQFVIYALIDKIVFKFYVGNF